MNRFQYFPGGQSYTIQQLQEKLAFTYLPHNVFEDQADLYERGLKHEASPEAKAFGEKYIEAIRAAYIPRVSVHDLGKKVGHGLFAEEEIEEDAYVGEYTGIVRKNDRRYGAFLSNYCYEYPVPDEMGRSHVIDAESGNLTRFINHNEWPNLKPVHAFYEGYYHLIFISLCPIKKGEQLCFHYGKNYWYVRQPPLIFSIDHHAY